MDINSMCMNCAKYNKTCKGTTRETWTGCAMKIDLDQQEDSAHVFVNAIRTIASKPENLDNLESYLSVHFAEWLATLANTPARMTGEMRSFAEMDIAGYVED